MNKFFYLFAINFILLSCFKDKQNDEVSRYELIEKFVDSTKIGKAGFNKVIIENFRRNDDEDNFVLVQFFEKVNVWKDLKKTDKTRWKLIDRYYFDKDGVIGLSPRIHDFNNDGLNDFLYCSGIAARGSNEVNTLFIFSPKENKFYHIKNSQSYPNLFFNKELNCINSFVFTGSQTTVFLRLDKDSLKEFASVDFANSITIYENDKKGKSKLTGNFPITGFDSYTPFKNYNPLQQYTETELNKIRE